VQRYTSASHRRCRPNYFGGACCISPNLHFIPERSLIGFHVFQVAVLEETRQALKQSKWTRACRARSTWRHSPIHTAMGGAEVPPAHQLTLTVVKGRGSSEAPRGGDTSASSVTLWKPEGDPLGGSSSGWRRTTFTRLPSDFLWTVWLSGSEWGVKVNLISTSSLHYLLSLLLITAAYKSLTSGPSWLDGVHTCSKKHI